MREGVFGFFGREAISDQDTFFFGVAAGVVDPIAVAGGGADEVEVAYFVLASMNSS